MHSFTLLGHQFRITGVPPEPHFIRLFLLLRRHSRISVISSSKSPLLIPGAHLKVSIKSPHTPRLFAEESKLSLISPPLYDELSLFFSPPPPFIFHYPFLITTYSFVRCFLFILIFHVPFPLFFSPLYLLQPFPFTLLRFTII